VCANKGAMLLPSPVADIHGTRRLVHPAHRPVRHPWPAAVAPLLAADVLLRAAVFIGWGCV
jgi:hypothetical protein